MQQKISSTDKKVPTVKWMLAPDWMQKMLFFIVPNRQTASPEFFSCVRTQWLLSHHTCLVHYFAKVVLARETSKSETKDLPMS